MKERKCGYGKNVSGRAKSWWLFPRRNGTHYLLSLKGVEEVKLFLIRSAIPLQTSKEVAWRWGCFLGTGVGLLESIATEWHRSSEQADFHIGTPTGYSHREVGRWLQTEKLLMSDGCPKDNKELEFDYWLGCGCCCGLISASGKYKDGSSSFYW